MLTQYTELNVSSWVDTINTMDLLLMVMDEATYFVPFFIVGTYESFYPVEVSYVLINCHNDCLSNRNIEIF